MTTYVLGDLPLNEPVKTGRLATLQGAASGEVGYNNTVPEKPMFSSPGGGSLSFSIQPPNAVYLRAMAMNIWRSNDAIWSNAVWGVKITPNDIDNLAYGLCYTPVHSAVGWQCARITQTYRLAANVNYTITMMWVASPLGYSQINYAGPEYQLLHGFTLGEGRV